MTILGVDVPTDVLTRVLAIAAIAVATLVLMRIAGRLVRRSMAATEALPATSILVNITRAAVLIMGALAILSVLDISITPM
ncbi:MAG TPA: hypothetical protein VLQ52_05280, partial [Coriobacteriia bacterium]|nr:hypothetical protein [Coriobacteriia bacterium]